MATPSEGVIRHKYWQKILSTPSKTPTFAGPSSYSKQELSLHDWWLVKADSDCHGRRLGVGGLTSRESKGVRCFLSAPILKRDDAVTFTTVDGVTVMVNGHLNRSRTLKNGFSHEVCDHFAIGFPYYWEEFAAIPTDLSDSERVVVPNGDKVVSPGKKVKAKYPRHSSNLEDVEHAGQLTRSKVKQQTGQLTRRKVEQQMSKLTRSKVEQQTGRLTRSKVQRQTCQLTRSRARRLLQDK